MSSYRGPVKKEKSGHDIDVMGGGFMEGCAAGRSPACRSKQQMKGTVCTTGSGSHGSGFDDDDFLLSGGRVADGESVRAVALSAQAVKINEIVKR